MFSAWLCIEFYSYPELAVTNHGYPFLVLFDHFMAPAGNSEKSEQGREESLFRPNRTGMFCVTIIVYYSLFWRPGLKSHCGFLSQFSRLPCPFLNESDELDLWANSNFFVLLIITLTLLALPLIRDWYGGCWVRLGEKVRNENIRGLEG